MSDVPELREARRRKAVAWLLARRRPLLVRTLSPIPVFAALLCFFFVRADSIGWSLVDGPAGEFIMERGLRSGESHCQAGLAAGRAVHCFFGLRAPQH